MSMNSLGYAFKILDIGSVVRRPDRAAPGDVQIHRQELHVVALPDGREFKRLSGTRALCAAYIKPQRVNGR